MKISLLVPEGADLDKLRSFVRSEIGEARNIKSKSTRTTVTTGLSKLAHYL